MISIVRKLALGILLAIPAWAGQVDAEALAKLNDASFHWFPVQKTFILVSNSDTLKFAIGLPYASSHGQSIDLARAPELQDGHIWLDSADAVSLFKTVAVKSSAVASSSSVAAKSSAATAKSSVTTAKSSAATVPAAPKNETAGTREVKTIVIDPGHGGKDTGAQGKKSYEKDIVLAIG